MNPLALRVGTVIVIRKTNGIRILLILPFIRSEIASLHGMPSGRSVHCPDTDHNDFDLAQAIRWAFISLGPSCDQSPEARPDSQNVSDPP
jgi:hypothetical protein